MAGTEEVAAAKQAKPLLGRQASDAEPAYKDEVEPTPLLFFDGHCNLCNFFVNAFLKLDRGSDPVRVKLSSLQSPETREVLSRRGLRPEAFISPGDSSDETVVFICAAGRLHVRSAAVLRAVAHVAPWWLYPLCMLALLIPTCLRDAIYKFVARHRIWFFGAVETCRRATKEDKKHFL
tara:strand:+ start:2945 stop:3478 length:534 start_codon:yes stop_codon:yes gene_type:complete|eukprot:scaffold117166_cov66-Phaeocystis_antarctica.AAC.3